MKIWQHPGNWAPLAVIWLVIIGIIVAVSWASAKETTSLEDALERPVKVERYIDQETGVACYWVGKRGPRYLSCIELGITRWNKVKHEGATR